MSFRLSALIAHARQTDTLPVDQNRFEVRLYAICFTGGFLFALVKAAMYLLAVPLAVMTAAAHATGAPWLFAAVFGLCALVTLPHFLALCFFPRMLHCRLPRRLACGAGFVAALLWAQLGTLAQYIDVSGLWVIYWANAFGYLIISAVYALSLNTQLLRQMTHHEKMLA